MPGVAELADAPDSKSGDRKVVKVRLLSPGPESPLRVYTVSSQNPDFGIISLQRFAQRLHQKALKNAILVDLCGVSVSKVYTRDRTPRYEVRLDFDSSPEWRNWQTRWSQNLVVLRIVGCDLSYT